MGYDEGMENHYKIIKTVGIFCDEEIEEFKKFIGREQFCSILEIEQWNKEHFHTQLSEVLYSFETLDDAREVFRKLIPYTEFFISDSERMEIKVYKIIEVHKDREIQWDYIRCQPMPTTKFNLLETLMKMSEND